ncbi:MAG: cation:proton antiporter, partial [Nitrospinales bacterium]
MPAHLIQDLTILLLVSLPINIAFHKIKLPSVMGFLVAGIIIGPYGLQWINDLHSVEALAEIGVVLLLFVIGLEFSLRRMLKNVTAIIGCGGLQMGIACLAVFLTFKGIGFPPRQAVLFGLLTALSSTAIVLKMITDRAEIDTLHGRICIGTLLFQDLCVVPMMLVIPFLGQTVEYSAVDLAVALLKSLGAVALIFVSSRLLVPRVLEFIVRMGNKEILTLSVILILLGSAWVAQAAGLTLAMGAFIAGLILSDSDYNHQIILDIFPLRDYFGSIFFISMGMILQVQVFFESFLWFVGLAAAVVAVKTSLTLLAALLVKTSFRISFIIGLRLAQIGEFSLLLANLALDKGVFPQDTYQSFLIVSILTMLISPVLIQYSSQMSIRLFSRFASSSQEESEPEEQESLSGHVIIAGFGLVGKNLSRVLREIHIPFLVVELDGERVRQALTEEMTAFYGDATHRDTLLRAGIQKAKMIVFAISDHAASEQGIQLARQLHPSLYIMARTRFASQVETLDLAGADQVIPDEFETSIEIFSRVLKEYHVPNNVIEQQVELVRLEGYRMLRGLSLNVENLKKFSAYLAASLTESFHVLENSWSNNKSLEEVASRNRDGARLIAVARDDTLHTN